MTKPGAIAIISCFLAAGLAAPSFVSADKRRIVLLDIDGPRTGSLQRTVGDLLKRAHLLLPEKAYRRAANRKRARKLSPKNIRRVCADLGCDAILDGVIEAEDGGYIFVLRIREGATGRIAKRVAMRLKKPRLSKKMARGLRSRLLAAIDRLEPVNDDNEFERDVADFTDEGFGDEFDRSSKRRVKRPRRDRVSSRERDRGDDEDVRRDDSDRDSERDEGELDDEVPDELSRSGSDEVGFGGDEEDDMSLRSSLADEMEEGDRRSFPVAVVAGVSVQKRDLRFAFNSNLQGAEVPTAYQGSPAPGVYIKGELYPMAFSKGSHPILKNIGFGFTLDRVLGLKVETQQNGMTLQGSAVQQRAEGEIRYRHNFGAKDSYPSLIASVGYGQLQFTIADNLNLDVPDVAYQYLNPGLTVRVPFGDGFAIEAAGRFMAVLSAGDIQLEEQYGAAKTTGVDGDLFFEMRFAKNFLARAGAHVTFIGFDFDEAARGDKTDRNGDNMRDVGGAADLYLGGYITLGYMY